MTPDAWIMLAILAGMFGLLIWSRVPPWAIFVATLTVTMSLRLAPQEALLKGFANPAVWTVGALYVVAAGMYSTGAITLIADRLVGFPRKLGQAMSRLLPPVAVGSAFLNNTPIVVMLLPILVAVCFRSGIAPSGVLIPMGLATLIGGMATTIGTSTNLLVNGALKDLDDWPMPAADEPIVAALRAAD